MWNSLLLRLSFLISSIKPNFRPQLFRHDPHRGLLAPLLLLRLGLPHFQLNSFSSHLRACAKPLRLMCHLNKGK